MDEIKIEKNIPIPRSSRGGGKWMRLAEKMEVGDSVLLKTVKHVQTFTHAAKKLGMKAVQRKCEEGIRVWIVESKQEEHSK